MIRHVLTETTSTRRSTTLERLMNQTVQSSAFTLGYNSRIAIEFTTSDDLFKLVVVDRDHPRVHVRGYSMFRFRKTLHTAGDDPILSVVYGPVTEFGRSDYDGESPWIATRQLIYLATGL